MHGASRLEEKYLFDRHQAAMLNRPTKRSYATIETVVICGYYLHELWLSVYERHSSFGSSSMLLWTSNKHVGRLQHLSLNPRLGLLAHGDSLDSIEQAQVQSGQS